MATPNPIAPRTPSTPPFVAHCQELLSVLGSVRTRRMFGGHGFYAQEVFVALIAGERLYLKTDATTRERFVAAAGEPFTFEGRGKTMTTGYWSVPADAMDSPAVFAPWARLALAAAVSAAAAKAAKAPKALSKKKAPPARRPAPPAKAR